MLRGEGLRAILNPSVRVLREVSPLCTKREEGKRRDSRFLHSSSAPCTRVQDFQLMASRPFHGSHESPARKGGSNTPVGRSGLVISGQQSQQEEAPRRLSE